MRTEILNKFSKKNREEIIRLEGLLREKEEYLEFLNKIERQERLI